MKLVVDHAQRFAKMRAHTATHLLHAELAKIFPATKQAGSFVDDDVVRFDFLADRLLNDFEIDLINKHVNQTIYAALPVQTDETSYDEAVKKWAKAFFEDKYGEVVRCVQIHWDLQTQEGNEPVKSVELCGWTHVENTKDIWCFFIVSQEAVASWVKRINAVTGPKVYEKIHEVQGTLDIVVEKLWIKTITQLGDKLDKTLREYDEMKKTLEWLEDKMIHQILASNDFSSGKDLDKIFKIPVDIDFKNVVAQSKWMFENQNILIYTAEWNFVLLVSKWWAKTLATKLGLKWWGSDSMVQGRDEKVLTLFK